MGWLKQQLKLIPIVKKLQNSSESTLSAIIFRSIITDKHHGDMQKTGLSAGLFYVRIIQVVIYVFSSIVQAKP